MKRIAQVSAIAAVLLAAVSMVLDFIGYDVLFPNIGVATIAAGAITVALWSRIVRARGRPPAWPVTVVPLIVLFVGCLGEWAASRGAQSESWLFFPFLAGIPLCLFADRERWRAGQLSLYFLLSVFATAGAAISGLIWGLLGETRTDEAPLVVAIPATITLVVALTTVPQGTARVKAAMIVAVLVTLATAVLLPSESVRVLIGCLAVLVVVWGLARTAAERGS